MDETMELTKQEEEEKAAAARQSKQKEKYMTFQSGDEFFGLKIEYLNEIIPFQTITEIPETEEYVRGLINLRGKMIPVIDVRLRFGQEPFEYNDRTCIIVINVKSMTVGLVVERIAEVVEIEEDNILPPPTAVGKKGKDHHKYVYGIGKVGGSVKLLLDPEKLLSDGEVADQEDDSKVNEEREG